VEEGPLEVERKEVVGMETKVDEGSAHTSKDSSPPMIRISD